MSGAIPPLPQYTFIAWCSVKKKHRDLWLVMLELEIDTFSISYTVFIKKYGNYNENLHF